MDGARLPVGENAEFLPQIDALLPLGRRQARSLEGLELLDDGVALPLADDEMASGHVAQILRQLSNAQFKLPSGLFEDAAGHHPDGKQRGTGVVAAGRPEVLVRHIEIARRAAHDLAPAQHDDPK